MADEEQWSNWSGSVTCEPGWYLQPSSVESMKHIMAECRSSGRTLRVAGAGHSFSALVETDDLIMSLENWTGVESVDYSGRSARVKGGTPLREVTEGLHERGTAMHNLGDINKQTLAGAMCTGTHGTGREFGVLSTQSSEMELLTPGEGIVTCSETENPDWFKAAQVSLGALGIITEIELDIEPQYNLKMVQKPMELEECLDRLEDLKYEHRHFEFFWFPGTEWVMTKTLDPTGQSGEGRAGINEFMENSVFGTVVSVSSSASFLNPLLRKAIVWGLRNEEAVGPSHEIFPTPREVKFNEMEYSVPAGELESALRSLKAMIERDGRDVIFPVECRFARGDDIFLSPAHGRDSAFLAVHKYHKKPYESYFRACEEIFLDHDGRPHWGKMHFLDSSDLRRRYPKWGRFQKVRGELDPEGIMLNDHLRRIITAERSRTT